MRAGYPTRNVYCSIRAQVTYRLLPHVDQEGLLGPPVARAAVDLVTLDLGSEQRSIGARPAQRFVAQVRGAHLQPSKAPGRPLVTLDPQRIVQGFTHHLIAPEAVPNTARQRAGEKVPLDE